MPNLNGIQEEFVSLIARAGWKPAVAARALHLTEASVSRYVNGLADPKAGTMELLRRLVMEVVDEADGGKMIAGAFEQQNADQALAELERIGALLNALQEARANLKEIISRPYRIKQVDQPTVLKSRSSGVFTPHHLNEKASSKLPSEVESILDHVKADEARRGPQGPPPSPATGERSAQSEQPRRGAGKGSSRRSVPGGATPTGPKDGED